MGILRQTINSSPKKERIISSVYGIWQKNGRGPKENNDQAKYWTKGEGDKSDE